MELIYNPGINCTYCTSDCGIAYTVLWPWSAHETALGFVGDELHYTVWLDGEPVRMDAMEWRA